MSAGDIKKKKIYIYREGKKKKISKKVNKKQNKIERFAKP